MDTVIETRTGWMIRCRCRTEGWHEFSKVGRPNATWTFNGNMVKPTFSPSMNELCNGPGTHHHPEYPTTRCHFTVTDGRIQYHGDCTHDLKGQTLDLEPWPEATVRSYKASKEAEGW
jgi:hypothetical protein